MDLHRQAEGLNLRDHLIHLGRVEVRRTPGGRVQIGLGLRPGLGLVGAVADDLDAIEREQGIIDGRAFPEALAAPGRQAFHVVEHHARAGAAGERIRELRERLDPVRADRAGLVQHGVADGGDMPGVIRDRLGRDIGRDLAEEVDREFEHRAFLVDHAVELAVRPPTEMTAARHFADILGDSRDLQRFAVDAGVVPVGVPDEYRMVGRDRIEFGPREIPALQKIVEIGADDPLPFRRVSRFLLQMRDEFFAGRIFGVADVVEQFENQRSQNRVVMRIDQARQQRSAGEIDDLRVTRLEARQRAFVADRKHLAALDRDRRADWRARQAGGSSRRAE